MKYKTFFFDFDGVLADTEEVKTLAFAEMFEDHGPEVMSLVADHQRGHFGMNRFDNFCFYYSEYLGQRLDEEELKGLCERFSGKVVDKVVSAPEIAGAKSFLEKWTPGVTSHVISAVPQDEIRLIVERRGLGPHFKGVYGAPQAKAEHVARIMEEESLNQEECLFFGDASGDYKAARACSIDFLAVLPGPDAPLLERHPHVRWVPDFQALVDDPGLLSAD